MSPARVVLGWLRSSWHYKAHHLSLTQALSYRIAVECPGCPLQSAVLDVEGEIFYRNIAGGLEHPVAQPGDLARVGDDHVGVDDGRVVLRVSTGNIIVRKKNVLTKLCTCCRGWCLVSTLCRTEGGWFLCFQSRRSSRWDECPAISKVTTVKRGVQFCDVYLNIIQMRWRENAEKIKHVIISNVGFI